MTPETKSDNPNFSENMAYHMSRTPCDKCGNPIGTSGKIRMGSQWMNPLYYNIMGYVCMKCHSHTYIKTK